MVSEIKKNKKTTYSKNTDDTHVSKYVLVNFYKGFFHEIISLFLLFLHHNNDDIVLNK